MGQIDDELNARARRDVESAPARRLGSLFGAGWRPIQAPPEDLQLVADFVSKLAPDAGQEAYWVDLEGGPSVHLPGKKWLVSMRELKKRRRELVREERKHRRGDARLLVIGDSWDGNPQWPFVRIGTGPWTPAVTVDSDYFGWAPEPHNYHRRHLLSYLVAYLQDNKFVRQSP